MNGGYRVCLWYLVSFLCSEWVLSQTTTYNCTLLVKYPAWLADKHAKYVKWSNESFLHHATQQNRFRDLFEANYDELGDVDYSGNDDNSFWAEKFAGSNNLTDTEYFKELYRRRAQAMFNRKPVREVYNDDPDYTYITEMDKQLINQTIYFPDDYGIPTKCVVDNKIPKTNPKLWRDTIYIALNVSNPRLRQDYKKALSVMQFMTCVKFQPVDPDNYPDHFVLVNSESTFCGSFMGRNNQHRMISSPKVVHYQLFYMQPWCFIPGTMLHELMHLVGVIHEHERFDRDLYLKYWRKPTDKVKDVKQYQISLPKTPYRYDSCMHYPTGSIPATEILTNSSITNTNARTICTLSDFNRVNYMYGCTEDSTEDDIHALDDVDFPVPPPLLPKDT